jgi:hypothetical protein
VEIWRKPAASTFITFPLADATGFSLSGRSITGTWIAWSDTTGPYRTPGFANLSGLVYEIPSTGIYSVALATTELPTSSPYVLLRFTDSGTPKVATQYLLIRTSSQYADVIGIQSTNVAPVTAGYMPIDVKQTISLSAPADNSIEKSLARSYMAATNYIDAAVSQGVLATTLNLTAPTDNTLGKALSRVYMMATNYVDAAISSRSAPATAQTIDQTTALSGNTDNSIGKTLSRLYHATAYLDAAVSTRSTPSGAQTIDQTVVISGSTDNSIGKLFSRLYHATAYLDAAISTAGSTYADAILGRTLTRGASGGRTVQQALQAIRNHVNLTSGTLTVYSNDDSTVEWTASVATQAVTAVITDIDPA